MDVQNNRELIKAFYTSFQNKDPKPSNFCHDDIEWMAMDGMPNGGVYIGIKSVFDDYFPKMLSNFKEFHANPFEFLCIDNRVIVFGFYQGRSILNKNFSVPFCHVYTILDNKISNFKQFTDTEKIQNAIKF